jgi:hypothetical protein
MPPVASVRTGNAQPRPMNSSVDRNVLHGRDGLSRDLPAHLNDGHRRGQGLAADGDRGGAGRNRALLSGRNEVEVARVESAVRLRIDAERADHGDSFAVDCDLLVEALEERR